MHFKADGEQLHDATLIPDHVRTRRYRAFEPDGHMWKRDQLLEWSKRLGNVPEAVVKKTFLATTQLVPSVRHENELFPGNQHTSRFPILRHRRLNEAYYADVVEFKSRGSETRTRYGFLIYGAKSKALAYYWNTDDTTKPTL